MQRIPFKSYLMFQINIILFKNNWQDLLVTLAVFVLSQKDICNLSPFLQCRPGTDPLTDTVAY